jgi:2-haloalkanoic acid dehalogenase type II
MRPEAPAPRLLTFDVFGTLIDWHTGLGTACAAAGRHITPVEFEAIIDAQSEIEHGPFRPYAEITATTLEAVLGLDPGAARHIGATLGGWPPFPDAAAALRRLMRVAPVVAMTNSDRVHGQQARCRLGLDLSDWVCAEDVRAYKPSPAFWRAVSQRTNVEPGPDWWHVSAYSDYDLEPARVFGLTTVFVGRPHARPGPADLAVADLAELAHAVERRA